MAPGPGAPTRFPSQPAPPRARRGLVCVHQGQIHSFLQTGAADARAEPRRPPTPLSRHPAQARVPVYGVQVRRSPAPAPPRQRGSRVPEVPTRLLTTPTHRRTQDPFVSTPRPTPRGPLPTLSDDRGGGACRSVNVKGRDQCGSVRDRRGSKTVSVEP